jgi:hypothetical protein
MITDKIYEFKNSNPILLDYDGVIKTTKSFVSLSPFWFNKKELLQLITPQNFILGFQFGVIITVDNVLFVSNKGIKILQYEDIQNIHVDLNKMKVTFKDSDIGLINMSNEIPNLFISFQKIFTEKDENFDLESDSKINILKYVSKKDSFLLELIDLIQNNQLIKSLKTYELHNNCSQKESLYYILKLKDDLPKIKREWEREDEIERLEEEKRVILESERKRQEEIQRIEIERIRKDKLESSKSLYISSLDKDNDGEIDLVDCDSFTKLLNTKQKNIIEIDRNYIQKFVKISIYIKTKKNNIQKLFQTIKSVKYENELEELVGLLQNQVHTYNLLLFHSINMITSLTESELITFYEIYECFDKLGVFNSNWENEVSKNLQNINSSIDEVNQSIINLDDNISRGLQKLMYSINEMETNIINSINELTYITEDSFNSLNHIVIEQLSDINSSLNFNNLLTGIQTHQMYKINQNTKRIN